jgi:hypothetical protein
MIVMRMGETHEAKFILGFPSDYQHPRSKDIHTKLKLIMEELVDYLRLDTILGHLVFR